MVNKSKEMIMAGELLKLADLGGFSSDYVQSAVYELYPDCVIEASQKYYALEPGFLSVADAVDKAYLDIVSRDKYEFPEIEGSDEIEDLFYISEQLSSEFNDWVIDQVARLASEKVRNGEDSALVGRKLPGKIRNTLYQLNALDERIMHFISLSNGDDEPDPSKIAEMEEFNCKPEYISTIINYLKTMIISCGLDDSTTGQIMDIYASR